MRLVRCLLVLFLTLGPLAAPARTAEFLEPTKAFRIAARVLDEHSVEVSFEIARGYYMYREQFRFDATGASLGMPELPRGVVKFDETFQREVETLRDRVAIRVPVREANGPFRMTVTSQGCADAGLCYPPMASVVEIGLAAFGGDGAARVVSTGDAAPSSALPGTERDRTSIAINTASPTDEGRIEAALRGGRIWSVVGVFFAAGVLLSLTPCVLPMLPIVSSIVVGTTRSSAPRSSGLLLASSYSLGMALVYTALGIGAGLAGEGLAAWLQAPWVLASFALVLVGLALSMFGFYELRVPTSLATALTRASERIDRSGAAGRSRFVSTFLMGGISALIVSPCIAAPLAGALVYLSQTGDVRLGGTALFSLAAGMSVPLLAVGASAGALLPRAGAWMEDVKRLFGLLLLGVAIWIVQPALPASFGLALWGMLALSAAVWVGVLRRHASIGRRAVGGIAVLIGVAQLVGAASGGGDPLRPLAHLDSGAEGSSAPLSFRLVRNVDELDAVLAEAGKPVMLDFYADWCVSCKEMERFTFSDARVQQRLAQAILLKADVTKNTADDRELMRRFGLFGPPGTLFFDETGREIANARVIGFLNAPAFLRTLQDAGL